MKKEAFVKNYHLDQNTADHNKSGKKNSVWNEAFYNLLVRYEAIRALKCRFRIYKFS